MDTLQAWDQTVFDLIHTTLRSTLFDYVLPFVSEKWNWGIPLVAILLYLFSRGVTQATVLLCSGILLILVADASATALKGVFRRPRPLRPPAQVAVPRERAADYSFPSNHATNAFALATLVAVYNRSWAIPAFIVAGLVGYARIYVGDHYPTDVAAGALLGTTLGVAAGLANRWPMHRRAASAEESEDGQATEEKTSIR